MSSREANFKPGDVDPWDDFCEQLKRAGRVIGRGSTPRDELTVAEGYRHLARQIRVAFEATFEYADPESPRIYQSVTPTTLGEGETADARYHQAFIDGSATHRISGRRGGAPLIEFTAYAGKIGIQDASRQVGWLTEQELVVDDDGAFEIVLSPEAHAGNWIRTDPETNLLFIRQYAHDWSQTESASFEIRREGAAGERPSLRLEQIRAGLAATAKFVDRAAHFWAAIVDRRAAAEPNRFYEIPADPDPGRPTMPVGHRFSAGYFRLEPDEALVLGFCPKRVPYWGIDFTNYWFEPLSYEDHRSHVNNRSARYEPDGSVQIVVSQERPDASNWIDLRGHREGTMIFRWSRTPEPLPPISARVVKLANL